MTERNWSALSDALHDEAGSQACLLPKAICAETMISGKPRMADVPGGSGEEIEGGEEDDKGGEAAVPKASRIAATEIGPVAVSDRSAKTSERRGVCGASTASKGDGSKRVISSSGLAVVKSCGIRSRYGGPMQDGPRQLILDDGRNKRLRQLVSSQRRNSRMSSLNS